MVLRLRNVRRALAQPLRQPLQRELVEVRLQRVPRRDGVMGQVGLAEREIEIAELRHAGRVPDGLGPVVEGGEHLLRGLHVELVGVEAHPVRLVHRLAGLQAEQQVVHPGVGLLQVVAVVGGHERDAELLVDLPQALVGDLLLGYGVLLDLQEIVVLAEDVAVFGGGADGIVQTVLADEVGHLAAQAAGEGDEALMVLGQQVLVHARLVVEAFQVRLAGELEQVLVAGPVRRQQDQVKVLVMGKLALAFPVEAALGGHVGLAADDRFDAGGGGLLVELDGAKEVSVVGNGDGRHAEILGFLDEGVDLVGPVEETVLGVDVEVDKLGRHAGFLLLSASLETPSNSSHARV